MNTNRYIGWCAVGLLLVVAIYCEFKLGNPFGNAVLDVVLACAVFYIGYKDANKKNASLQNHLQELQKRIEQLEGEASNPNNSNKTSTTKSSPSIDWEHAIKR
jgi:CHASE3 domain sensor protein